MKVGESVRKSIDDWAQGEAESAMLHACNAVDGTAAKRFPRLGSNGRFTRLLRESYDFFGPMGVPGVNLVTTRWPVRVRNPKADGGYPDIADVVYGIHRCTHGHGDELPDGFALVADAAGPGGVTRMSVQRGTVRLSDRVIFALLAVAIVAEENVGQVVPNGYHLTFGGEVLPINDWWGRAADLRIVVGRMNLPSVHMDFTDWMEVASPLK
jgi:hypothetical protein